MRKQRGYAIIFLLLVTPFSLLSQHHHEGKEVEHLTFWDTLFGSEEEFQVCYPKDHQSFFYAIIALTIISLAMAIFIFYSFRKYNRKLKNISAVVHEKNTEMLDSIRYAQRIQNTILPTDEEFKTILPGGFVIYKPKDIVSGDFYWVHQVGKKKVIAVIDCTGHGVPGAFLSLIGSNALKSAVKEIKDLSPNDIFHHMNGFVKESLRQLKASDVTDGMEGSLAIYDEEKQTIEFAGARMNMIHVSNGELTIHRGSKLTVGTVEDHVVGPPTKAEVKINSGDCIYLYSDGVVDQFGDNNQGKYKISRLKQLLIDVAELDALKQGTAIQFEMQKWQGVEEQIDDITMIGVKF